MNQSIYSKFVSFLDNEDKDQAISYVISLLTNEELTLEQLYLDILSPSLANYHCEEEEETLCIWKEHARTSIVRTILEATYPFVIERKKNVTSKNKTIMVVCPSEEYHEIGAIIVAHFLSLAGYNARYIGANTPKNNIVSAVKVLHPDFVAISVTNYYNLVITKKITEEIKKYYPQVKIIVGGQAFIHPNALAQVTYDYFLSSLTDLSQLEGGKE
ncbi:MAG: B12-binding domain-containing protein [Candidatus Izemoplasmatales bacterium]